MVEAYAINSAPRSDALELASVAPKEMVRVLGLSSTWYVKQTAKPSIALPCCKGGGCCTSTATFKLGSAIDGTANMFNGVETSSPLINLYAPAAAHSLRPTASARIPSGPFDLASRERRAALEGQRVSKRASARAREPH